MAIDSQAKLAVLIDSDNVPTKFAKVIFEEIAKLGDANIRRIYGDFENSSTGWKKDLLLEHAIVSRQQHAYTSRKNSTDIAMVIDAMDLLHRAGLDGFCLVSSDSDFTGLAIRLREEGAAVYGFGEQKTPNPFRRACTKFILVENLLAPVETSQPESESSAKKRAPAEAVDLIKRAIEDLDSDDGWISLGVVGHRLNNIEPDFDPRSYGCAKLSGLVEKAGAFDILRPEAGGVVIRPKKPKSRPKK